MQKRRESVCERALSRYSQQLNITFPKLSVSHRKQGENKYKQREREANVDEEKSTIKKKEIDGLFLGNVVNSLFLFRAWKACCRICSAKLQGSTREGCWNQVESARAPPCKARTFRTWIYTSAATILALQVSSESELAPRPPTHFLFSSPLSPAPLNHQSLESHEGRSETESSGFGGSLSSYRDGEVGQDLQPTQRRIKEKPEQSTDGGGGGSGGGGVLRPSPRWSCAG